MSVARPDCGNGRLNEKESAALPGEVKTETFSEKYDGPTARLTKSFETGNPMRKGCSNSNKGDYNFEALAASNQTIAYSSLTAVHENKKAGF